MHQLARLGDLRKRSQINLTHIPRLLTYGTRF